MSKFRMTKFKKGDRVKNVEDPASPKGAIGTVQSTLDGFLGGNVEVKLDSGVETTWLGNLIEKCDDAYLNPLAEGDILINENGHRLTILGVAGKAIFIGDDRGGALGSAYTHTELQRRGFKLKTDFERTELTKAEVEEKLGLAAGSLTIVD